MTPSNNMEDFQRVLKASKNTIVIAGAGLSVASGIPTYREIANYRGRVMFPGPLWADVFKEDPSLVWEWYHYRREMALKTQPNAAHVALARFSIPSVREGYVVPGSRFTLITQVSDGLSALALADELKSATPQDRDAISSQPTLFEMHGRLFDVKCTECGYKKHDRSSPICEGLAGTEDLLQDHDHPRIPIESLPHCSYCGALARPGVIWFGEKIPLLRKIKKIVVEATLCLVVGIASMIDPAAEFVEEVKANGSKIAVFNTEETSNVEEDADFFFKGPCEDTLPQALGLGE
ncbi:hypothetical protein GYMLUDRAFT_219573 [Collybiopsis luxurians FD-317 M1]|nr:hypothetical protein GYMLUDRAFT_219573 [Collybiopsis luxurians FD-317 M1]